MTSQSEIERDKAVVDAFYQAGIEGHLTSFARYLDPDFKVTAPNYLPWGGTHSGAAFFRDEILPNLPDVFDFARFSYDSVIAEGGRVSAVINMGVAGTDAIIKIVDVWTVRDGRSRRSGSPISSPRRCSTNSASPTSSPADGRRSFEAPSAQKTEPHPSDLADAVPGRLTGTVALTRR
jgi:ketosteroid isomerase-like protein